MIDVWRHRKSDTKRFMWSKFDRKSHMLSWSRIDMFLISSCLMNKVSKCEILPGYASDHSIITLELNLGEQKRGPGYWKLNNMLLQDEKYVNIINEGIDKTLGMFGHLDPSRKWELLKFELAGISKEYAQFKRKKEKWKRFDLYRLLGDMQDELVTSPSLELADNISLVTNEISAYEMLDTKRVMFCCKQQWHQLGEHSSRYHFNMEKLNYISKTMYEVRKNNGELTKDYHEILNEQKTFYQELYSSNAEVHFSLVNQSGISLSDQLRTQLEVFISEDELFDALMTLKTRKVCGVDGLTLEFYWTFWRKLVCPLHVMLSHAIEQGRLSTSARHGIINLILKKGKDDKLVHNW